jgi:hypothetical protein
MLLEFLMAIRGVLNRMKKNILNHKTHCLLGVKILVREKSNWLRLCGLHAGIARLKDLGISSSSIKQLIELILK